MGDTNIAWTDKTWNPSTGCTRVSEGCDNCYAFKLHDQRYMKNLTVARDIMERPFPGGALQMATTARDRGHELPFPAQYDKPFSQVQLLPDRLDAPLHWRKPQKVFVNSMSDLFHEDVPDEFIDRVVATMALTPWHTYQVLTKRPERMREYMTALVKGKWAGRWRVDGQPGTDVHFRMTGALAELLPNVPPQALNRAAEWFEHSDPEADETFLPNWPLPNVWLGVSVENQAAADLRIPQLMKVPAAVHWASAEPLLGHINFRLLSDPGLDWIVVGGESGPRYRKMDHAWASAIREQCRAARVAFFGKQDSGPRPGTALPPALSEREFPA